MSQANCDYILQHNKEIPAAKIEICPNCIEIRDLFLDNEERMKNRLKYNIPLDKKVFVYGGNLGKPQGINFLIECLKTQENSENAFFLIVGDGTEFGKLQEYCDASMAENMKLMKEMPKEDYDRMISACDVDSFGNTVTEIFMDNAIEKNRSMQKNLNSEYNVISVYERVFEKFLNSF